MAKNTNFVKLRAGKAAVRFFEKSLYWMMSTAFRVKPVEKVYSVQIPENFYSPWLVDNTFKDLKKAIANYTFLDDYKLYEIWKLVEQVKHLTGDILEVGVWRGGSGCLMAKKCALEGIDATVFLCDTFQGLVKTSDKDSNYTGGEHADTSVELVEQLLRANALTNAKILRGIFPDDTSHEIADRKFRLCHIDVDIYQSAKETFQWVWPRLVPGGVVIFDDYGGLLTDGVTQMVNEVASAEDRVFIHNLNGHGVMIKRS